MDDTATTNTWQRMVALYEAALALPADARTDWLLAHCGDASLRAQVHSLLNVATAVTSGGTQLHPEPGNSTMAWTEGTETRDGLIGAALGSWQVERVLGSGGMGTVYLGRRTSGDFEQQVAIKVLHIGAGPNDELARRFRAERQILAQLDHPYIARLLDGGTLPGGAPYLVMELVEGDRIDRYCERHGLTLAARIELLIKICRAVQAAHRALVVHRDLKPDNILIDAHGEPKLLDFGIAKVLDNTAAAHTRADQRLLTPRYAAPEQFTGDTITTGTDIYALGVILYELLTGQSPYRSLTGETLGLIRMVCEIDPEPPSRRRASQSQLTAAVDAGRLSGDLDAIALKALRKRPADRYGTVDALIDDLQRYQRHLPVQARQGSRAYLARKFIERHRLALAVSGMLLAGVLATALTWREQRDAVIRERDKARQVTDFLLELFDQGDPFLHRGEPPSVRQLIERGAARLDSAATPELGPSDPELRAEMGIKLSKVLGQLGAYERAYELAVQAQRVLAQAPAADPLLVAGASIRVADAALQQDRTTESAQFYATSLELATAMTPANDSLISQAHAGMAELQRRERHYDSALAQLELAMAAQMRELAVADLDSALQHAQPSAGHRALAPLLHARCRILVERGPASQAQLPCTQTLHYKEQVYGADDPILASTLTELARIQQATGDADAALASSEAVLKLMIRSLGSDHPNVAVAQLNLGADLRAAGRLDEAQPHTQEALRIFTAVRGPDHAHTLLAQNNLANLAYSRGDYTRALNLHQDIARRRALVLAADHPDLAQSQYNIGKCAYRLGQWRTAQSAFGAAIAAQSRSGAAHSDGSTAAIGLALVELASGQPAAALARAERAVAAISASDDPRYGLASALFAQAQARLQLNADDSQALSLAQRALAASEADQSRDLLDIPALRAWIASHQQPSP